MQTKMVIPLFLAIILKIATAARILMVPAQNIASHTKSMYPVADDLAKNGHEVVVLQLIKDDKESCKSKQKGVTDLVLKPNVTITSQTMPKDIFWKAGSSSPIGVIFPWKMATDVCMGVMKDDKTRKEFDRLMAEHWDALIIDSFFAPCGLVAIEIQKSKKDRRRAVVIEMSTSFLFPNSFWYQGVPLASAAYPTIQITEFANKKFTDRLHLFLDTLQLTIFGEIIPAFLIPYVWSRGHEHARVMANIRPAILGQSADYAISSLTEMLDFPRATTRAIGATDMDCPIETNPLPEPYASFVEDPKSKGTILFAMGHFTDWTYAPPGAIVAFIDAFARLSDYRIIWQFAQDASKLNVTSNVLIKPWIPQMGILYHPKTKLFISHMGLKSLREAICAKMPVAAMPMFAEQGRNTAIAKFHGFGVYLNKVELTVENVYSKLSKIFNDRRFADSAAKLQDQLADQIEKPLELVTSRIDWHIRRNTDRIMDLFVKIRGSMLPFYNRYQIDSIFASSTLIFVMLGFLA